MTWRRRNIPSPINSKMKEKEEINQKKRKKNEEMKLKKVFPKQ